MRLEQQRCVDCRLFSLLFLGLLFGHAGLLGLPLDDFRAGGLDVSLVSIFLNPTLPLNVALALVAQ